MKIRSAVLAVFAAVAVAPARAENEPPAILRGHVEPACPVEEKAISVPPKEGADNFFLAQRGSVIYIGVTVPKGTPVDGPGPSQCAPNAPELQPETTPFGPMTKFTILAVVRIDLGKRLDLAASMPSVLDLWRAASPFFLITNTEEYRDGALVIAVKIIDAAYADEVGDVLAATGLISYGTECPPSVPAPGNKIS